MKLAESTTANRILVTGLAVIALLGTFAFRIYMTNNSNKSETDLTIPDFQKITTFGTLDAPIVVSDDVDSGVKLHEDKQYSGESFYVNFSLSGGCQNFPSFQYRISSVNTTTCVTLWSQPNCIGDRLQLQEPVSNLIAQNFNDKTNSVCRCGKNGEECDYKPLQATLYSDTQHAEKSGHYNIYNERCKDLHEFNDRANSVKTNRCIRLFEDMGCQGKFIDIKPPGIPNLGKHGFYKIVSATSGCFPNINTIQSFPLFSEETVRLPSVETPDVTKARLEGPSSTWVWLK